MAIKTVVFWGTTPEDQKNIKLEMDRLISLGATDGSYEIKAGRVVRPWTTVESAQGWIDFLNSLDQNPISAEVVEE